MAPCEHSSVETRPVERLLRLARASRAHGTWIVQPAEPPDAEPHDELAKATPSIVCSSCRSQLNLSATPPTVQPAPQPQVTSLSGARLVQADAAGNQIFLAYNAARGGPAGQWSAAAPNQFTTSIANESAIDLAAAGDGTMFASRASTSTQIRGANLTVAVIPASPELEQISTRVLVPGLALHPSGALLYQPFLTGPAPSAPSTIGIQGGVDVIDAHTGLLRLRIFLPEPLSDISTDVDALHGSFQASAAAVSN